MTMTQGTPAEMRMTARTLYASFPDASLAEKAIGALLDYGVPADDISLVAKDRAGDAFDPTADAYNTGDPTRDEKDRERTESAGKSGISTTTSGDAVAGAEKGAGIGLGVGIVAALASIFVPGFGFVAGGGALAMAIGAAAATTAAGAVAGGVTGYLKDQGVPDEAVVRYNEDYNAGGAVLAVTLNSDNADEATVDQVLAKYQGRNINSYVCYGF